MKIQHTLIALAAATFAFGAQAIEFRSADVHNSDDYPTVAAVKHMSELLDKRSNGKYKIKVFNKSALGSEKETLDQVKIGALEMNRVNISALNSICPKTLVPTMPFLFDSIAHMRKSLDGPIGEEILKGCEHEGLVGLAFYDSGARSIYAKKPVKTLADAKGLKIRVQQSDLWVALVSAMGANATPMPAGEVFTALKTGLIDAAENNIPSYDGFKHYEAVKFYSRTEHSMVAFPSVEPRQRAEISTDPDAVNLMALVARLRITWRTRASSPITAVGICGSISARNARPFSTAPAWMMLSA